MYKTFIFLSGLVVASIVHPVKAEPLNLSQVKTALVDYHDSGQYMKELRVQVQKAKQTLLQAITKNQHRPHPQKLAVVLDIDETVLSNYEDMKKRGFGGTLSDIHHDIKLADALPIKPMRHFYHFAQAHHVTVFFVTGRNESERHVTIYNLKQAGFSGWQHLYLKPNTYHNPSIIPFKLSKRKAIQDHGYTIVETIGDQKSDYAGGRNGTAFKLPNPYYALP